MIGPFKTLLVDLSNRGILTITLNRPDKLNALNQEVLDELSDCLQKAKTNITVKALLITGGGGKAFCAGADIEELKDLNAESGSEFAQKGQTVFRMLETLGKPSLAVVNGVAYGGGNELAMACSMRIASNKAKFAQPEIKLGIIPGYGGTQRLSRLIGKGRAIEMCVTGRIISAENALAWGLINELTIPDQLMALGNEILTQVIKLAPLALKSALQVIDAGFDLSLEDAINLEALHFGKLCGTKAKNEGVAAFLNKREPYFKGE